MPAPVVFCLLQDNSSKSHHFLQPDGTPESSFISRMFSIDTRAPKNPYPNNVQLKYSAHIMSKSLLQVIPRIYRLTHSTSTLLSSRSSSSSSSSFYTLCLPEKTLNPNIAPRMEFSTFHFHPTMQK